MKFLFFFFPPFSITSALLYYSCDNDDGAGAARALIAVPEPVRLKTDDCRGCTPRAQWHMAATKATIAVAVMEVTSACAPIGS